MNIKNVFTAFNISASGMSAQRKRMNVIANNMANAETTRTENGEPYRRQIVRLEPGTEEEFSRIMSREQLRMSRTSPFHFHTTIHRSRMVNQFEAGVRALEELDESDFKLVYEPSHPDADDNGYVRMPNINIVTEMVDMIAASRAFEANATAINAMKSMAKDSLEI